MFPVLILSDFTFTFIYGIFISFFILFHQKWKYPIHMLLLFS